MNKAKGQLPFDLCGMSTALRRSGVVLHKRQGLEEGGDKPSALSSMPIPIGALPAGSARPRKFLS